MEAAGSLHWGGLDLKQELCGDSGCHFCRPRECSSAREKLQPSAPDFTVTTGQTCCPVPIHCSFIEGSTFVEVVRGSLEHLTVLTACMLPCEKMSPQLPRLSTPWQTDHSLRLLDSRTGASQKVSLTISFHFVHLRLSVQFLSSDFALMSCASCGQEAEYRELVDHLVA